MEGEVKGSTFKMRGHTLPGISQRSGGNKSSAFQQIPVPGVGGQGQFGAQPPIPPPVGGVGAMGGMDMGIAPPIMSKPSVAKIYKKPKGKRTEY